MVDATAPAAPKLTNGNSAINPYNTKPDSVYKTDATSFAVSYQKAAEGESPVTVKAKVDSGEYTALSADAPKVTLIAGTHTVKIKTVDAAGNESAEVTYQISVQTKQASEQTGTEKPETSDKQQEAVSRILCRSAPAGITAFIQRAPQEGKRRGAFPLLLSGFYKNSESALQKMNFFCQCAKGFANFLKRVCHFCKNML